MAVTSTVTRRGLIGRFLGRTVSEGAAFAAGVAIGPVLAPPVQALRNDVNAAYPFVPLQPTQAVQAEIAGGYTPAQAQQEAKYSGLDGRRYKGLRAFAGNVPAVARMLELWNRGEVTGAQVTDGLQAALYRPEWVEKVKALRWELPSGDVLAQMAVQGILSRDDAAKAALLVGTDGPTFDKLYRLHGNPPAPEEALTLWNRGEIKEADVDRAFAQSRLKPEWFDHFKALRYVVVPVSDLIRMAVREVFNPQQRSFLQLDAEYPDDLTTAAGKIGLREEDARDYWAAHWELPSYTQGLEMLHRGELSQDQFDQLLKALDYAPTWRDKLRKIGDRIPPISDMIRFAVREVYSPAQRQALGLDSDYPEAFTAEAALHGMDEERAKQYWAAHWRLPSAQQGYRMLWRNQITPDELDGLLKALDYPELWRDRLANIAHVVPGRIDTRRMYAAGLITRDQAINNYMRLGYTRPDAEMLVGLAKAGATTAAKEATATDELALFTGGRIDRATVITRLKELGYSDEDANRKADVTEARLVSAALTAAMTGMHRAYVKGYMTDDQTRTAILALGQPQWVADGVIARWKVERDATKPPEAPAPAPAPTTP